MQEYVEFLAKQSPYDRLDEADLAVLARHVEVEFFAAGTTIVKANGPELEHLYVVRTGAVQVVDGDTVLDELGPGDTFGHISVVSGLPPPLSVIAVLDTLCYLIPDPRKIVEHGERLTFAHYNNMAGRPQPTATGADQSVRPVEEFMREPLWCEPGTPIRVAAQSMSEANQSCILYRTGTDIGIMTDSDCRRLVATGEVPPDDPVSAIATAPARTILASTPGSTAFVEMIMHGVHHLVVVDDSGRAVGVTRVFDLSSAEIRDPLTIRAAVDRANNLEELAEASSLLASTAVDLHDAGVAALRTGALLGAIMEAIVAKCVSFDPYFTDSGAPATSWLVLGSVARREPLPYSDIDTALVWRKPPKSSRPEANDPLLERTEGVIQAFERCGLRRCADGANASNPLFNRSVEAWLQAARTWFSQPDREGSLLLSSMMTDSRPVTGLGLGRSLNNAVEQLTLNKRFLKRTLDEALARRPPTGFVRDFVVEANGEHRGKLNLKRGGISPVVSIGRWIAVTGRMPMRTTSTQDRLAQGAEVGLLTKDEADTLRGAHREMVELLFSREIEAMRANRAPSIYLDPKELDSLTRRHLRESFRAIARVQGRLETEWISRIT